MYIVCRRPDLHTWERIKLSQRQFSQYTYPMDSGRADGQLASTIFYHES